jgi:predicted DNA-binding protein (UPF0278 family)
VELQYFFLFILSQSLKENKVEEGTRKILMEFLEALAGLTAKVLELEEIVNKLKPNLYEIKTNAEIAKQYIETFNKKEEK